MPDKSNHNTAVASLAAIHSWPADICVQLADLYKKEDEFTQVFGEKPKFHYNHFLYACGLTPEGDMWIRR